DGSTAPRFIVIANIVATDGGAAIVAGNERVLRARLSDARFFWNEDLKRPLESLLPKLAEVTFHARLGTQRDRVDRLVRLAGEIAPWVGADRAKAERAALLCKADLVSGMVGEFPELQGVMGRYYALAHGEDGEVANAIRDHYAPRGAEDEVPAEPVSIALALADRLDQLASFFAIGEKPTGSGDPYALRRAALGVVRIVRDNCVRIDLARFVPAEVLEFVAERLRVQLRAEGKRHDIVAAVLGRGLDGDLVRVLSLAEALEAFLASEDGANLRTAHARAVNMLRIEERKDGRHYEDPPNPALFAAAEERALASALDAVEPVLACHLAEERFAEAMATLAALRAPLDGFFDRVTVNDPNPALRANRLRLLGRVRRAMARVADFSKLEG
ncbi:MAG: glycine--tRNA ligase subunit beta, partial [Elioraea sp.]|nr:glycine--tRNA ligase subunit beta [Elioraea sp.]